MNYDQEQYEQELQMQQEQERYEQEQYAMQEQHKYEECMRLKEQIKEL